MAWRYFAKRQGYNLYEHVESLSAFFLIWNDITSVPQKSLPSAVVIQYVLCLVSFSLEQTLYPRFGIKMANNLQLFFSLTLSQTNSELNKYKPVHNRKSQNDSSIIMTQSLLYLFICLVLLYTVLTEFRANVWNSRHTSGQHYDLKSLCGIKGGLSDFLLKNANLAWNYIHLNKGKNYYLNMYNTLKHTCKIQQIHETKFEYWRFFTLFRIQDI